MDGGNSQGLFAFPDFTMSLFYHYFHYIFKYVTLLSGYYRYRRYVTYVSLALGIPGNILSAIVWLRRHVTNKNSSAVYLAALAINDLACLLSDIIVDNSQCYYRYSGWLCYPLWHLNASATKLEPLLVLGFSVERLIAIVRPLQVCC